MKRMLLFDFRHLLMKIVKLRLQIFDAERLFQP